VVDYQKVKVHGELVAKIGKGILINRNGLGVELE
jgi:hypothetical protein